MGSATIGIWLSRQMPGRAAKPWRRVPVFYWDRVLKLDVMEEPDGRKYEIRFVPGAPRNRNYHIVRMLDRITD